MVVFYLPAVVNLVAQFTATIKAVIYPAPLVYNERGYVVVLMQHSTCYLLVRIITTELELERKRFFFSFLCDGKY